MEYNKQFLTAIKDKNLDSVQVLLQTEDEGNKIILRNNVSKFLHSAIEEVATVESDEYYRLKEIINLLLINDADISIRNDNGKTPLHLAFCCKKYDLLELLLATDTDRPDKFRSKGAVKALTQKDHFRNKQQEALKTKIEREYEGIWKKIKVLLREISDNWNGTYKTSTTLKQNFKGPLFQIKIMMLIVTNSIKQEFVMGNEVAAACPFDDIVLMTYRREEEKRDIILIQLKHKDDSSKNTIKISQLESVNGDYSLVKYFREFSNIITKDLFKDADEIKDLVIVTTMNFEFEKGNHILNEKQRDSNKFNWGNAFESNPEKNKGIEKLLFINDEEMKKIKIYSFKNDELESIKTKIEELIENKIEHIDKNMDNILYEIIMECNYLHIAHINNISLIELKECTSSKLLDDLNKIITDIQERKYDHFINKFIDNEFDKIYNKYKDNFEICPLIITENSENKTSKADNLDKLKGMFEKKCNERNKLIKSHFNKIKEQCKEKILYKQLKDDKNVKNFIEKIKFVTSFPNVDKLDDLIEKKFKNNFNQKEQLVNSCIQDEMIKEFKFFDENDRSEFYKNFNQFYQSLKDKIYAQYDNQMDELD